MITYFIKTCRAEAAGATAAPRAGGCSAYVLVLCSRAWKVTRAELESLIAAALLRERTFRPKRRTWNETWEQDEQRARIIAAAIVAYLERWLGKEKLPALAVDTGKADEHDLHVPKVTSTSRNEG